MENFRHRAGLAWEHTLSGFKYLIAISMLFSGVITAFGPTTAVAGSLGIIYSSRVSLVILGIIFFLSGCALLYGKIRKSKRWTGYGLMAIYCCFIFAALMNGVAFGFQNYGVWVWNAGIGFIMGMLYLRWKFKVSYLNPRHFQRDIENFNKADRAHK